jgi:hypothetical protein
MGFALEPAHHDHGPPLPTPMHPHPFTRSPLTPARPLCVGVIALLCLLLLGLSRPAPAAAAPNIELGLFDDAYVGPEREMWLKRSADAGARSVRIPVRWKYIAPQKPANPRQPGDPYRFWSIDRAVKTAIANGLQPVLNLTTAPAWAERGRRNPAIQQEGAWNPDPAAFGDFARAVATRYSGAYGGNGGLPRVSMYEAWNEPNYGLTHLAPQWRNGKPYGVKLYRQLLNAMHDGVKDVRADNKVIAPSLGPQGRTPKPNGKNPELAGVRPLFFLRELFCLKHNRKMTPKRCPPGKRARFDILSHHPINPAGTPAAKASHPDAVIGGDIGKLRRVLIKAQKAGNLHPAKVKRPIWVTEFWWETNPPNRQHGVKPMQQARNIAEALYVFWRAKVQRAFGFRIHDTAGAGKNAHGGASGLYNAAGQPKPSLTAFRFPFVADRRSKRKIFLWGKAPTTGQLAIEQRNGGSWRVIRRIQVQGGNVFTQNLKLAGKRQFRASIGDQQSLVWPVKKK